jgi:hypothetical protein
MDRESILEVIGSDLGSTVRGSGPTPAERLMAKFNNLGPLAAQGIVDHYSLMLRLQDGPRMGAPAQQTDAEFRATLQADIDRQRRADDDRTREYMASLRRRIDSLKEPDAPDYDEYAAVNAWEAQQRQAEMMADVVGHEVAHCTVGLSLGCRVREILVRDDGSGVVYFDDIPAKANLPVTIAGSMHKPRGIADDSGRSDRIEVEAEVDRRCPPDATPIQREHIRAAMLEAAEDHAESILSERWEFVRAMNDRLAVEKRISGREVHTLWDSYFTADE